MDAEQRARLDAKRRTVGYVVIHHADFRALLTAYEAAVAALQTMLKTSEEEAIVSYHDLDGSCNCRMCRELIPMMQAALAGEEKKDE